MSLSKFLDTISRIISGVALSPEKEVAITRLNPDKIYPEHVRALFGISAQRAVDLCEAAVRQGKFQRRVEVVCPDGSIAASANTDHDLPNIVHCWLEDQRGELEESEFPTASLPKVTFYRLNAKTPAILHS